MHYPLLTVKLIPRTVFDECRKESEDLWKDGKPKKWYYAIPVAIIWILIVILIIKTYI